MCKVAVPWGQRTVDNADLTLAKEILDEDHYGLEDVKDRILEFMAVVNLRKSTSGKIICLVGPPGTGKTSVGKSIARALNRKFYRFSLGGLTDTAELRGHRRTYVGAMPGKVIQCFKQAGSTNPVMLLDEVDKLGKDYRGDPASALLEILDPSQNKDFRDHYLDVAMDLSDVLFICTANSTSTIPEPLLDRMEVLRIAGYVAEEKSHIARNHLIPIASKNSGVKLDFQQDALNKLIHEFSREAGVRSLLKLVERCHRKAALTKVRKQAEENPVEENEPPAEKIIHKIEPEVIDGPTMNLSSVNDAFSIDASAAENVHEHVTLELQLQPVSSTSTSTPSPPRVPMTDDEHSGSNDDAAGEDVQKGEVLIAESEEVVYDATVTPDNLTDYVGQPVYHNDRLYAQTPPGVVMGLAWTSDGGASLYIEATLDADVQSPGLKCTGMLKDVMKESTNVAMVQSRRFLAKHDPTGGKAEKVLTTSFIHLHVPEGAVPKDGPSAGVTISTALLSLAMDRPVKSNVAMTGEVTLTGKVLKVGGIKEKLIAARRENVDTLILPKQNERDYAELKDYLKEGLTVHFVEDYQELLPLVFDPPIHIHDNVADVKAATADAC